MKITGQWVIKGRGPVVGIDALSAALVEGMYVRRVAPGLRGGIIVPKWLVVGIETLAMPRSHTNGKPAGLLLRGDVPLPGIGSEVEIDENSTPFRRLPDPWYCESGVSHGRRQGCSCVPKPEPCDACVEFARAMNEAS